MTEYLCLTLLANAGETEAAFKRRLAAFWTHMIRTLPAEYERVYSEEIAFESEKGRLCRRYMVEPDAATTLTTEMTAQGMATLTPDQYDLYSKAEASGSEWFQIPHD